MPSHLSHSEVSQPFTFKGHDYLAMQHTDADSQFFERLEKLFANRKGSDHGAITLTQKRCESKPNEVNPSVNQPAYIHAHPHRSLSTTLHGRKSY